jgi:serine/threonine protein kinase
MTKTSGYDTEAPLTVPDIAGADAALSPGSIAFDASDDGKARVILGAGQFGTVYRGRLFGEAVAIKCMPLRLGGGATSDRLLAEVAVLKACRSDFVVQYRGHEVRADGAGGRELLLATEVMAGGDLRNALDEGHVSWGKGGARIALDVASGLQYLHSRSPRILHLDIKSKNVLLAAEGGAGDAWRAKIADYGISQVLPASRSYLASNLAMQGTLAWAAPEQLLGQRCTVAADVFALGVVLWELVTGEGPVRGRMRDVQAPEECPPEVAELMTRCWAAEPGKRPSAAECVTVLQKFI